MVDTQKNQNFSKKCMLVRGLGLVVLGFLFGITLTSNAQLEEALAEPSKTELIPATKEVIQRVDTSTGTIEVILTVPKLDIEKTTTELITDKIILSNEMDNKDKLISDYAQKLDTCRATSGTR